MIKSKRHQTDNERDWGILFKKEYNFFGRKKQSYATITTVSQSIISFRNLLFTSYTRQERMQGLGPSDVGRCGQNLAEWSHFHTPLRPLFWRINAFPIADDFSTRLDKTIDFSVLLSNATYESPSTVASFKYPPNTALNQWSILSSHDWKTWLIRM